MQRHLRVFAYKILERVPKEEASELERKLRKGGLGLSVNPNPSPQEDALLKLLIDYEEWGNFMSGGHQEGKCYGDLPTAEELKNYEHVAENLGLKFKKNTRWQVIADVEWY